MSVSHLVIQILSFGFLIKKSWFSIKSFCYELTKPDLQRPQMSFLECVVDWYPHRIEIFTCLTLLGKRNTKDKLIWLAIVAASNALCVLCNSLQESCDYLLLHCPMSWLLWNWWLNIWNLQWSFPSSIREAFDQWKPLNHGVSFKKN